MEKLEILRTIKTELIETIYQYQRTNNIQHVTPEYLNKLSKVWDIIMRGNRLDTHCSTCVKYALDIIESWYSRESKKEEYAKQLHEIMMDGKGKRGRKKNNQSTTTG